MQSEKDKIMELLEVTQIDENGAVTFTDRSIEILKELGEEYSKTALFKRAREEKPDWEGETNAGLLYVYMCEKITEAPSRIHIMVVTKLMIPLIWEKLQQEATEKLSAATEETDRDMAAGGLLSAT
jgi:hypothetical protein